MTILDNFKKYFQKKDYTFEVITANKAAYDFGNVELAKKSLPLWFKNLPSTMPFDLGTPPNSPFKDQQISTVKYCPALQEIYTKGIIIHAWCDMKIAIHPDGGIDSMFASPHEDGRKDGSHHPYHQRAGWMRNMTHWKIHSPYWFKTSYYRRWLFSGAYQQNEKLINNNLYIVNGVIDFYVQHANEINILFPIKPETYIVEFNLGDPLVHLLPLDDDPIKIKNSLISLEENKKLGTRHPIFHGNPKLFKNKRSLKS